MQTETRPKAVAQTEPPRGPRGWIPALAGAVVVAAAVLAVVVFSGQEPDPAPPATGVTETTQSPEATQPPQTAVAPSTVAPSVFGADLENVGAVLTTAMNSHDPEEFLSLFAEDGVLSFFAETVSPGDIRAGATLLDIGFDYVYDRTWARALNVRFDFSPCQATGDRVLCDVTITSDHLKPILQPALSSVAIRIEDGVIVEFVGATRGDPTNEVEDAFRAWAFENYPEEAARMWLYEWDGQVINTEESALLHLELGEEYVRLHS